MKLLLKSLTALSFLFVFAVSANAGGFEGPGAYSTITRAQEVHHAALDTPCVLEGRLVKKVNNRKDHYIFEDQSGQVNVQITRDVFGDQTVSPADTVRISGEVKMDGKFPKELEVEALGIVVAPRG